MAIGVEQKPILHIEIPEGTSSKTAMRAAYLISIGEHRSIQFRIGTVDILVNERDARRRLIEEPIRLPH